MNWFLICWLLPMIVGILWLMYDIRNSTNPEVSRIDNQTFITLLIMLFVPVWNIIMLAYVAAEEVRSKSFWNTYLIWLSEPVTFIKRREKK